MTLIVTIEGNIGSGKTTLLQDIQNLTFSRPHVVVFENVTEWLNKKNSKDESILELFYTNQEKYSYIFQSYVLFSRVSHLLNAIKENPNGIVICERCHLTDLMVFANSLYELKKLNDIEWSVYQDWHQMIRKIFILRMDAIIYNRASPEICLQRICKRSRSGESSIELDYLSLLHNKHDDWLVHSNATLLPKEETNHIMVMDGNIDYSNDTKRQEQLSQIVQFVNGLLA
jgi:deoxycitidine kinase